MARKQNPEVPAAALHKLTQLGMPLKQVAAEAGVSSSTLRRWLKQSTVELKPALIERSGKDVPLLFIANAEAFDIECIGQISTAIDFTWLTEPQLDHLSERLDRLSLQRAQRAGGDEYLPGKFMPAAQQAGLMGSIDAWVIRHTAKLIKAETAHGRHLTVFVNISRDSLLSETFCGELAQLINNYTIDPQSFVFEVPESELIDTGIRCQSVLVGIRALGCATLAVRCELRAGLFPAATFQGPGLRFPE